MPSRTVSTRIQISQNRPKAIAASDSVSAIALTRLRRAVHAPGALRRRREQASLMSRLPSPFFSRASSSLDSASTTKVMKNSISPR